MAPPLWTWRGLKWQEGPPWMSAPMTLLAKEALLRVARPRSPILTEPEGPVIKTLSHLRSRCRIGGTREWRK